ncbi:MAG: hypothetical protein NUV81_02805 [bacterium]|nr:hypothetical protein [bacterium]
MKSITVIRHKTEEKVEKIFLNHIPAIGWTLPKVFILYDSFTAFVVRESILRLVANAVFLYLSVSHFFTTRRDMILRIIGGVFVLSSIALFYFEEGEIGFIVLILGLYWLFEDLSFEEKDPFAEANRALKGKLWKPKQPGERA